jgi:hypothetical protein
MLYAYIVINGVVHAINVSGLNGAEIARAEMAGWRTYWTTDRNALRDAEELALA